MVQVIRGLSLFALLSAARAVTLNSGLVTETGITVSSDTTVLHEKIGINNPGIVPLYTLDLLLKSTDKVAQSPPGDIVTSNPISEGVANPDLTVRAAANPLRPGNYVYIKNGNYYLTRYGDTGVTFAKKKPDSLCKFEVRLLSGCDFHGTYYISLLADNNLPVTIDRGTHPPALWLNQLYPVAAFFARTRINSDQYNLNLDVLGDFVLFRGRWKVTGANYRSNAIATIANINTVTAKGSVYIIEAAT
ncbi:hypothetical protein DFH06DRAFT_49226 [Mycena polygramma]|nr:hypothetical protein DFH06DRAFT_49226 [Mycena polygramma]